jgi:hypothetical protein
MRRSRSDVGATVSRFGGLALPFALLLLSVPPPIRLSAQAVTDITLIQNSGALFLLFPVGAQAVGMGQSAIALDGRGEAVFWNPAGLATLPGGEFALHSASLAAGNTSALTAFFPSRGIGVLGGAVYLVDYGDEDVNDSTGTTIARIAPRNIEVLASYATELSAGFAFGISYKLVEFRVDCSGDCRQVPGGLGVTHALDVGGQFTVGPRGALRVGMAVRNVGFRLQVNNRDQADPLPARVVVGAIYTVNFHQLPGGGVGDHFDVRFAADVDSPWGQVGSPEMRLGVDVGYRHLVRVRGGYAFARAGLSGPSLGLGVSSGAIGVDLARPFLQGSGLVTPNPTFISFRVAF